jgi:hypothetical protein
MRNLSLKLGAAILVVILTGCQSLVMHESDQPLRKAASDRAQIVFMRPTDLYGGADRAAIFQVDADRKGQQFIGIVSSRTELAYSVPPGDYLFMAESEIAEFMAARVEAGKTYYALVLPHWGSMTYRFKLQPVHAEGGSKYSTASRDFDKWRAACHLVEKTPEAEQWYLEHQEVIEGIRDKYIEGWDALTPENKAALALRPEDGI